MINSETFRRMTLQLQGMSEQPHFQKCSFRLGKTIVATLDETENKAVLKLSEIDQSVYSDAASGVVYPVPGAWGRKGWTVVELIAIDPTLLREMLQAAYTLVADRAKPGPKNRRRKAS